MTAKQFISTQCADCSDCTGNTRDVSEPIDQYPEYTSDQRTDESTYESGNQITLLCTGCLLILLKILLDLLCTGSTQIMVGTINLII